MFKTILFLCFSFVIFNSCAAQSFFKPLPKPITATGKFAPKAVTGTPTTMDAFRPLVGVTAIFSDATALAGGVGVGWTHNKFDDASQAWSTQYSISGLAFLDTKAGVTGAIAFGFLDLFSVGGGYNFTTKKFALLTGITIKPF